MASQRSNVVIHQTAPSIGSVYTASSASYPPSDGSYSSRSVSPADESYLRVYGASNHQSSIKTTRKVTVVNRHQTIYEPGAPTPQYASNSSYPRRH